MPKLTPFSLETREAASSYTDSITSILLAQASGNSTTAQAIGAAEVCAGQWGRAFMSAVPSGRSSVEAALTPAVLELIGRSLVRRGEAVFEIQVRRGRLVLRPAAHWDVLGGADPADWTYRLTFHGPDRMEQRKVSSERVVHVRYAVDAAEPWRGLSPLAVQPETAGLAAMLEKRLRQEASGQVAKLIALPDTANTSSFETNLGGADGRTILVPSTAGGWTEGAPSAPARDWTPQRHGADPPEGLVMLRDRAAVTVLAACGVPVLLLEKSDGTGLREAWRQFLFGTVSPVAKLVTRELADKLDTPGLGLTFDELRASDLAGRARAFQSMVGAGMDVSKAAALAGLMEPEG